MTSIIILAGGQGTRMKTSLPKILHPLGGKAMIHHVLDTALALQPHQVILVVSPQIDVQEIRQGKNIDVVVQQQAKGTGDAVKIAASLLTNPHDNILILYGDVPLVEPETLKPLINHLHGTKDKPEIAMLAMELDDPREYGRLKTNHCIVESIVEYKDATIEERQIKLCNPAIYLIPGAILEKCLPLLEPKNVAGEYYLTDVVLHAKSLGVLTRYIAISHSDVLHGINNLAELAQAEQHLQDRWRCYWMNRGVTMIDPASVYLSHDTIIGANTVIYPQVFLGPNVHIEGNVTLYPGCYIEHTTLKSGSKVGPFAHLRGGTILESNAEIGNFVECKNAHLHPKAKAKHLTYLGDVNVGNNANVGAGTITCNYNGYIKSKTVIGERAFIGSNTSLVAPVSIGNDAIVAAGSTITQDVPDGALGMERSKQQVKEGWAYEFKAVQEETKLKKRRAKEHNLE